MLCRGLREASSSGRNTCLTGKPPGLRTYYVLAGATPFLVHNCGEASLDAQADAGEIRGSDFAAEYKSRSGHVYRSDNKEPVTAPDEMAEIFEQQAHPMNGGCAEMQVPE